MGAEQNKKGLREALQGQILLGRLLEGGGVKEFHSWQTEGGKPGVKTWDRTEQLNHEGEKKRGSGP